MARGRYLRVYYQDLAAEFRNVWDNPTLLGVWLQLLAQAEDAWPRRPACPATVKPSHFKALVEAGIVTGDRTAYTIKGLDKQRQERSEIRRAAAYSRWGRRDEDANAMQVQSTSNASALQVHSTSIAPADANAMQVQSKSNASASQSKAKAKESSPSTVENVDSVLVPLGARRAVLSRGQPLTESGADDDELASVEAWMAQRRLAVDPVSRAGTELARLVDRFGAKAVIDAMEGLGTLHDGRQAIYGALRVLAPIPSGKPRRDHRPSVDDLAGL
jgi:hypothetical protein